MCCIAAWRKRARCCLPHAVPDAARSLSAIQAPIEWPTITSAVSSLRMRKRIVCSVRLPLVTDSVLHMQLDQKRTDRSHWSACERTLRWWRVWSSTERLRRQPHLFRARGAVCLIGAITQACGRGGLCPHQPPPARLPRVCPAWLAPMTSTSMHLSVAVVLICCIIAE